MSEEQQINNIVIEDDDKNKEKPCSSKQAIWTSRNLSLSQTLNENDKIKKVKYKSANDIRHELDRGSAGLASSHTIKEVSVNRSVQNTGPVSDLPVSRKDISDTTTPRRYKGNQRRIQRKKSSALRINNSVEIVQINTNNKSKRKRRGDKSRTSNSKRVKKPQSITTFYDGKLSNVVPFGRYYVSSDSDSDS